MNELFFELIRVAIGTQDTLSRLPSASEWGKLYKLAKKQSLVGVCFAGLQRLRADADEGFARIGMSEELYFDWMGNTFMIQRKNGIVNQQCAELQAKLSAEGFRSCILKGQGVGQQYAENLHGLRQSGDIDVWLLPNYRESENSHIARVVRYARSINPKSHFSGKHVDLSAFEDTEVELHVTPAKMNCPWHNRRLQDWFSNSTGAIISMNGFSIPDNAFNIVYHYCPV